MKDYKNINNLKPSDWGYCGWVFLNSIALTYNVEKKEQYKNFFSNLVLPCDECTEHYKQHLKELNNALENKDNLLLWLLNIRNSINKEKNKKILTLDESINQIFERSNNNLLYLLILFLIVIIVYLLAYRK